MKKYIYLLFFISCTIQRDYHLIDGTIFNTKGDSCNILQKKIKDKWACSDTKDDCYHYNKSLYNEILANQICFVGVSFEKILDLFGTPSYKVESNLQQQYTYKLSGSCNDFFFSYYVLHFLCKNKIVVEIRTGEGSWIE